MNSSIPSPDPHLIYAIGNIECALSGKVEPLTRERLQHCLKILTMSDVDFKHWSQKFSMRTAVAPSTNGKRQ
jgi:hypothetical protein